MRASKTHIVLLPTYNAGPCLLAVVTEVLRHWQPVLVVVDGCTHCIEKPVIELAKSDPSLTVIILPANSGKGAAVLAGARAAQARGFTHALVMDSDRQHPAASIAEFMNRSAQNPNTLILGRPVFPSNTPAARLHGRKLSVWLVHLELLGRRVADPLFGFRVYPLAPLLTVLGTRNGGRRYDFDTEAAVRLGWAGVPVLNLAAPVRYFSRTEGGVSHFHYLRDNATLVGMHLRLLTELMIFRWPALLCHRRAWRTAVTSPALLLLCCAVLGNARETGPIINPENLLQLQPQGWSDVVASFAQHPDISAVFTERRFFRFRRDPVELKGEVRVSVSLGLSLHYQIPEERIVILDTKGLLVRVNAGASAPLADPRAAIVNETLLSILRFDLVSLAKDFEIYGERHASSWSLGLVPRTEALRRNLGQIAVEGEGATIRRIDIRHSAKQAIEINIGPPNSTAKFTAEELRLYFR